MEFSVLVFSQGEFIQAAGTNVPTLFSYPRRLSPPPAIPECASAVAEADSVKKARYRAASVAPEANSVKEAWSRTASAAPKDDSVKEARSRAASAASEADSVKEARSRAASAAPEVYTVKDVRLSFLKFPLLWRQESAAFIHFCFLSLLYEEFS